MNSSLATSTKLSVLSQFSRQIGKDLFYRWVRVTSRMVVVVAFGFRTFGRHHLPVSGGAIILSTHQSMLDPVLVGLVVNGRLNYIARKSLFNFPIFAFFIRVLDAIEIDRDRGGLAGLRDMMQRLLNGKMVLLFPEGTRTTDGTIGDIKLGFAPIARRTSTPLVPVALSGANLVLPRKSIFPQRHTLALVVGRPISADEISRLSDDQLKLSLRESLLACKSKADQLAFESV